MRDLILKMSMSIDGFVADPDSGLRWIFDKDEEAAAWTVETVWNASLHIMGSRTFRDMAGFWPFSTDVFAPPMNQIPKAVFSKRVGDPGSSYYNSGPRGRPSRCEDQPNQGNAARRRKLG